MNVAYHLQKLGINPALITKIGLDQYGEKLVNILAASGVSTEYFFVDYEHPTGLVYANANDHNEVVYDIVFPSAWDFIEWNNELEALVKGAEYFVFGSLTSRNRVSRDTTHQLLEIANTKVLDINLRAPHYHRSDVEFLLGKADVLKMNIAELELITGWFTHFQDVEDRIKTMQDKFNINTIIITMGGEGALVQHEGNIYKHNGYKVTVEDTIGSGDSFLAGFLSQTLGGASVEKALDLSSAIGAFVATKSGACPEYSIAEINDLINYNTSLKMQNL